MSLKDAINAKKQHNTENKQNTIKEVTQEPMKRLNVNIPESRLKAFKVKSITQDTDMSTLINQWIEQYLK
jgi:predicted DNA binding CopG/RHH family protein